METKEVHITIRLNAADSQGLAAFDQVVPDEAIQELLTACGIYHNELSNYRIERRGNNVAIVEPVAQPIDVEAR